VAGATAFWGNILVLAGLGIFLSEGQRIGGERTFDAVLLASALMWAASCWRWGSPLFAGLSAISLFLFLSRLPFGRALWVLIGLALTSLVARRPDDAAWAPSHRRAAMVLLVAGVGAEYVASNVYSLDERLVEVFVKFAPRQGALPSWLFVVAAVATAVLPLAILWWAWKSRRVVLLDTGIVLLALSLVTLRHYVHVAPLWVVLTTAGALLIVLALAIERALRGSPGGERWGFTADPLFSDERRRSLRASVVAPSRRRHPSRPPTRRDSPDGGAFGGGGAPDKF
jgi:hypothetical protein